MGQSTQDPEPPVEPAEDESDTVLQDESDTVPQGNVPPACLNCGHPVPERFCGECGQKHTDSRLRTRELVLDYLGDLFNFESRLWRTVRTLFLAPGVLTREYLAGRRVRYSPPFRLLLVSGLAFGLVWITTRSADNTYYGYTPIGNGAGDYSRSLLQSAFLTCFLLSFWLKLFYLKSGRTLAEHAVFMLHTAAFGLVWMTAMVVLGTAYKLFWGIEENAPCSVLLLYLAGVVAFASYFFSSLRVVYPERAWMFWLKFLGILVLSAVTMIGLFFLILALSGPFSLVMR